MKAVILAAGKGTRMKDLTDELPKPMLSVRGRPILEHIVEGILSAGIQEICLVTGWKAEVIEDHFGDGERLGARISYVRQAVPDGTGKAPELARDFLGGDSFLLTYGDILVQPETYSSMLARFAEKDFSGLITVTEGQDVTKGAVNLFDAKFCLKRIVEKPSAEQVAQMQQDGHLKEGDPVWYNAGIYMFTTDLFRFTEGLEKSPRGEYELPDAINEMLQSGLEIAGLRIAGDWVDVRDQDILKSLK